MVYLLLYIDDIILIVSNTELLRCTISALQWEFTMKDLRPLHHFLGITVESHPDRMFLHQRIYTLDILKRAVKVDCKPCITTVDLQTKLADNSGPPVADASQLRSIVGALHYLIFTRPDIVYVVQQICLHIHDPREPHLTAMKHILSPPFRPREGCHQSSPRPPCPDDIVVRRHLHEVPSSMFNEFRPNINIYSGLVVIVCGGKGC
jgi:hypothetical protein